MQSIIRGLYAITDSSLLPPERFIPAVEQAILGGARIIQYRNKSDDDFLQESQAKALRDLCQNYQVPLIINDDIYLMQEISASGIHLGQEDTKVATARAILGETAIIGVSCYNQLSLAAQAIDDGASYIAFGSFFPSSTKPDAVRATVELLRQARQEFPDYPIVAIGGITPENGAQLIAAGADSLAVIQGVFGQPDIAQAAQQYARLFE